MIENGDSTRLARTITSGWNGGSSVSHELRRTMREKESLTTLVTFAARLGG
jgi:hypothetical protein